MDPELTPIERDARAVARVLEGDEHAFRELVIAYQEQVFACAWAVTRNEADAADAAQEAFIRLYRNLAQFDARRPLKPYLLRIAANCSHNLLARRRRQPAAQADAGESLTSVADPAAGPAAQLLHTERKRSVRRLVDGLPRTMREVCSLFYLAECSCSEVAAILNMGESTVRVALHRARRRLLRDGLGEWRTVS